MKEKTFSDRTIFGICIGITVVLIILTRALTIKHNIYLHPDEHVFFRSTERLVNYLLGTSKSYDPVKPYPEGTYVFHAAFQILFRFFSMTDILNIQLIGRIASICFFSIGVVLGFLLLRRCFGYCLRTFIIYGLTMIFSLFQLEQSRYGTSDPLSFMLLMLVLLISSLIYDQKGNRFALLILESIVCGFLGSIKYPLLYFCVFPLIAAIRSSTRTNERNAIIGIVLFFTAFGFFMTSPKTLSDISFIYRTIVIEGSSYIIHGNPSELGGFYNHILSVIIYMTVYSGLLGGPLLSIPLFSTKKESHKKITILWKIDIPLVFLGFFIFNIFAKTIFMRNFYLLACIIDLYACVGISRIIGSPKKFFVKYISITCLVITVLRGGYFFTLLTSQSDNIALQQTIQDIADENWSQTTIMGPGRNYILSIDKNGLKNLKEIDLDDNYFLNSESFHLTPGEMVITGTMDYSKCAPYILPISNKSINTLIDRWKKYKFINSDYLCFQNYPEWWYGLFGFWIKGTTGTDYEFPTNYIYYCPKNPL